MFKDKKTEQSLEQFKARMAKASRLRQVFWPWSFLEHPATESNSTSPPKAETSEPDSTSSSMSAELEYLDLLMQDQLLSGLPKTSKPSVKVHSPLTKPTTSGTTSTWNLNEHQHWIYQTDAPSAGHMVSEASTSPQNLAGATPATGPTPDTNSSLSLMQWFATQTGRSALSTPKPKTGRVTTLEKIGPARLKLKFICTHLNNCTRMRKCRALSSMWLRGGALRRDADPHSIAMMILAAHRESSTTQSEMWLG